MAAKSQAVMNAGMVQLLAPVVEQCDSRLTSVLQAQTVLLAQIDLFSAELAKSEQDGEQSDAVLAAYAAKLAASRKKLKKVEMLAMQTRDRVENIERMHEQLLASEKAFRDRIEGKPEEPPAQAAAEEGKKEVAAEKNEAAKEEPTQEVVKEPQADAPEEQAEEGGEEQAGGGEAEEGGEAEGTSGKKKKKKK